MTDTTPCTEEVREVLRPLIVRPGDVLVIEAPLMTQEQAEHVKSLFREQAPDVKCVILAGLHVAAVAQS